MCGGGGETEIVPSFCLDLRRETNKKPEGTNVELSGGTNKKKSPVVRFVVVACLLRPFFTSGTSGRRL